MPVMRKRAQIMHASFNQARLARPPHNPILQRPSEKLRKYRNNVKTHRA
jgi:uncharacterized coiled-coil DUF342 family protein